PPTPKAQLPEPLQNTKPDGCTATALDALLYPGAWTVSVVFPSPRPWTNTVPTNVLPGFAVRVAVLPPATVPSVLTVAIEVPGTLTVTVVGLESAAPTSILTCTSRSFPSVMG